MSVNLFIITGFGESVSETAYAAVSRAAKAKGYTVVPISIKWERATIKDWVREAGAVLSKKYKKVYGVDISPDAISYAKENWNADNIEFKVGSALDIPFLDNTFDEISAFEVFEHLNDWKKFLSEIKRVLKPGGLVYISTPNKTLYSPGTKKPINPHHIFEMTIPEFKDALEGFFEIESFYGQRTPIYNDHFIWKIVNPILFTFKWVIPYKVNNTLKLKIINWIKPELDMSDIILKNDPEWVERSRFVVGICRNKK